jgi:glucokinase
VSLDFGIDIGGTNIKLGLVDGRGKVVARRNLATRARRGPHQALERIASVIETMRRKREVGSIGVGIAGLVDHVHGVVRVPPNLPGWHGTPVKASLETMTGVPVRCANDANAATLGEWLYGAGKGCRNLFCLTLGTGVGGGAVVEGRLLLGANHAAGELGHSVIFGNGLECRCGGRGCVERYLGADYLVHRARQRVKAQIRRITSHRNQIAMFGGKGEEPSLLTEFVGRRSSGLTPREIGRAARAGDKLALGVVEETGEYLGLGLVNVVTLLDPERIVIGGGVSGLGRPLIKAVRKTVESRIQLFSGRRLEIVSARLGSDAGIVGASRLVGLLPAGLN